uniref:Uncharacterized protein n=1 Tax=Anguilla anguilla TaxID=7936 RepID=A0A0E9QV42_ANGAN
MLLFSHLKRKSIQILSLVCLRSVCDSEVVIPTRERRTAPHASGNLMSKIGK